MTAAVEASCAAYNVYYVKYKREQMPKRTTLSLAHA